MSFVRARAVPDGPVRGRTALMVVGFAVVMLVANSVASAVRNPAAALLVGPVTACAVVWLYLWTGHRIERRDVVELPRRGGGRHLVAGAVCGSGLAAVVMGILALCGVYRIHGWGSFSGALAVVGAMCTVAVAEEVFFRGIVFRLLRGRWGITVALIGSAVVFGLAHLVDPDASLWGAIAIAVEAGLLLGAVYVATGSLWSAIGLHFGWNVATVALFGTVSSGSEARDSLVTAVTTGPDVLSGGRFGPEASIVSILVCSAATVLLLYAGHRRGRPSPQHAPALLRSDNVVGRPRSADRHRRRTATVRCRRDHADEREQDAHGGPAAEPVALVKQPLPENGAR